MSKTTTAKTPPPATAAAKPPTARDIYEALCEAVDEIQVGLCGLDQKVSEAEGALRAAEAHRDYHAGKILRLMALKDGIVDEKARAAVIAEKWEDHLLRAALARCGGWKALAASGATDQQIADALMKWPESAGNSPIAGVAYFERGYLGWGVKSGDVKKLKFYVAASNAYQAKKLFSLNGQAVVDAARRLLGIPAPSKPAQKKPAAAKPATAPTPRTPAKKPATSPKKKPVGIPSIGAAAIKAANGAKAAAGAPKPKPKLEKVRYIDNSKQPKMPKRQTFNQWIKVRNIPGAALPDQDNKGHQKTLTDWYEEGYVPARAADSWISLTRKTAPAQESEPAAPPSLQSRADHAALAADPNGTPPADPDDADRIAAPMSLAEAGIAGETLQSLKEAYSYPQLQQNGTIKRVIQDGGGQDYAVMGMALRQNDQPDGFSLVPVMLQHEYIGEVESWAQRKKNGAKGRPPSLQGVRAGCQEDGETYVFVDVDLGQINVAIPKASAAAAHAADVDGIDDTAEPALPSNVADYINTWLENKAQVYARASWQAHTSDAPAGNMAALPKELDLALLAADKIDEKLKKLAREAGVPWQNLIGDGDQGDGDQGEEASDAPDAPSSNAKPPARQRQRAKAGAA